MKKIFLVLFMCFAGLALKAQSAVTVADPVAFVMDTTANVKVRLSVRVATIPATSTVYFLLGTAADASDVLNAAATVIKYGGSYFVEYNNTRYPVMGNKAYIEVSLTPQQYQAAQHITMYAKTPAGVESQRAYTQF